MAEVIATIASRVGLHARPAAIFAEAAGDLPVEVTIAAEGEPADEAMDAASILSLMSLGAKHGDPEEDSRNRPRRRVILPATLASFTGIPSLHVRRDTCFKARVCIRSCSLTSCPSPPDRVGKGIKRLLMRIKRRF